MNFRNFRATNQLILLSNRFDNTRANIQAHRMFSKIKYRIPYNNAKLISKQHTQTKIGMRMGMLASMQKVEVIVRGTM